MAIPVIAVAAGVSGVVKGAEAKRRESHIADRVSKYSGYSDSQLQDIIKTYGGEMGEAAQRVLSSRGSSAQSTAPGATIVERLTGSGNSTLFLVIGGVAVAFLLLRKR